MLIFYKNNLVNLRFACFFSLSNDKSKAERGKNSLA